MEGPNTVHAGKEAGPSRRRYRSCVLKGAEALLCTEQGTTGQPALCSEFWRKWAVNRWRLQV